MKLLITILSVFMLTSCQNKKKNSVEKKKQQSFFVGTYTDEESLGIYTYTMDTTGMLERIGLAATADNPSFLVQSHDNKFLMAVNEVSNEENMGTVSSYLISGDSLTLINSSSSGGAHPCFVTVNEAGFVLTANYTGGNIGLLKIDPEGKLTGLLDVQQHTGNGGTERQEGPHAHSTWFEPKSSTIISVDLGTNELWFSQIDTERQKLTPNDTNNLKMAEGAGPRHLSFHPNGRWIYVVNELNSTVTHLTKNELGRYEMGNSFPTLPNDFSGSSNCADIHISSDGKFLYVSNRGHNSIVIYKVNAIDGSLSQIGHESVRGDWPRNFSLSPNEDYLLVANQYSKNIVSFKRDKVTGLLQYVDEIAAPTPVCILFRS